MEAIVGPTIFNHVMSAIKFVHSFAPLVRPSVVLVPSLLVELTSSLASFVGMDEQTVCYTLGLFLAYPLGLVMLKLPFGLPRHVFSFLMGAFLLQYTIGVQWIHHLVSSLAAYGLILALPLRKSKALVPAFAVLYCVLGHLHRQFLNYLGWDLDFTGPQMVLTIKLCSLAYNLYDGECLRDPGNNSRAANKCKKYALHEVPSLVEYLGYTFCFSNILAGPAYEYSIYRDAVEGKLLKNDKNAPSSFLPTLKPFLVSLICMAMFVVGGAKFPILDPSDPQHNSPPWVKAHLPFLKRYCYQWVALFFCRQKYYFAWKNAEGANNIWFAGYEGRDEDAKIIGWDHANNVDIVAFETAPNIKICSAAWNKKTSNWLTRYVYMRTGGSLIATYSMSAFWHGFYPGYYMFFMSMPLLTACERVGRKKLSPVFSTGGKWSPWGIVTILTTSFLVEYFVMPFQVLAWEWGVEIWKSHYFFGHILCFGFLLVCGLLPSSGGEGGKGKKKKE
ncbi:hypothetical protein ScalyP_jg10991 [Parmales sp. scaly parma]|nr:hypothetical protein ScalyP_jg10991 [Parmales sp. scaly parma]